MAAVQEEERKQDVDKLKEIELKNKYGKASVVINPFGGTVTSWIVEDEQQLFVSSKAILDRSKAIRGGIPLVYPQFGPGI